MTGPRATPARMADLGGRPHRGKLHTRTAGQLRPLYPRLADFLAARDRPDPRRTFGCAGLARVLGP